MENANLLLESGPENSKRVVAARGAVAFTRPCIFHSWFSMQHKHGGGNDLTARGCTSRGVSKSGEARAAARTCVPRPHVRTAAARTRQVADWPPTTSPSDDCRPPDSTAVLRVPRRPEGGAGRTHRGREEAAVEVPRLRGGPGRGLRGAERRA